MRQRSLFQPAAPPASFPARAADRPAVFVPLAELSEGPGGPPPGIARLAWQAEALDHRNEVEYRDLPCRSLVSRVRSDRVPFEFGINPYRGCEFGCVYCYARYTHEFMELEDWLDFERKVFVKRGAAEALLADLRRLDLAGRWIAIGTATDPYQPAERRCRVTRSVLEVLARKRNLRVSVTTKSDLVARDADLLARLAEQNEVHVNVTVTTPRYELARRIEPRAPRPDRRLAAVKTLSDAGIRTGVFLMPLLPRINDGAEDLDLLCRLAGEAGASYLASQVLFLRSCSRKRFFPFIEERFPELLPYYRRLYAGRGTEALASYTRLKMQELAQLKRRYGLLSDRRADAPGYQPDQMALGLEP